MKIKNEIINVNGVKLSICQIGEGYPTVLVHGNRDNKENFKSLATELSNSIGGKYILVDLRGHGESEKVKSGYDIDTFVNDIFELTHILGINRFNYIGHSLGSTIGIRFASKFPELINHLVLMSAAAVFKIGFKRPEFTREKFTDQLIETNKRAEKYFFSEKFPEVAERIKTNWLKIDFDVHMQMIKLEHPDLRDDCNKIKANTLILVGEEDRSTTTDDAEIIHRLISDSSVEVLPGSHYMFLEYEESTLEFLRRFLGNE